MEAPLVFQANATDEEGDPLLPLEVTITPGKASLGEIEELLDAIKNMYSLLGIEITWKLLRSSN